MRMITKGQSISEQGQKNLENLNRTRNQYVINKKRIHTLNEIRCEK